MTTCCLLPSLAPLLGEVRRSERRRSPLLPSNVKTEMSPVWKPPGRSLSLWHNRRGWSQIHGPDQENSRPALTLSTPPNRPLPTPTHQRRRPPDAPTHVPIAPAAGGVVRVSPVRACPDHSGPCRTGPTVCHDPPAPSRTSYGALRGHFRLGSARVFSDAMREDGDQGPRRGHHGRAAGPEAQQGFKPSGPRSVPVLRPERIRRGRVHPHHALRCPRGHPRGP